MKPRDRDYVLHWLECKTTEILTETECDPEYALDVALELFLTGVIPYEYCLYFQEFGYVPVRRVISNAWKYDQKLLCDPMRYDHPKGHDEAEFHWNNGNPAVVSSANGGGVFRFADAPVRKRIRL